MSAILITPISPLRADAIELIETSNHYMRSLYPPTSLHLDGLEQLAQSNVIFLGVFEGDNLIGTGAVKIMSMGAKQYGEIKRVFISPLYRNKGLAKALIREMEAHIISRRIYLMCLETGIKQPTVIKMYQKLGYRECQAFGEYQKDPLSMFMKKDLPEVY